MSNLFFKQRITITQKLIAYFLGIGICSTIVLGTLTYQQTKQDLKQANFEKLVAVRKIKKNQITHFFEGCKTDIQAIALNKTVIEGLKAFENCYQQFGTESAAYDSLEAAYGKELTALKDLYAFYDLFLISPQGEIVYTVEKEADFATNLFQGPYRHSNLAQVFKAGQKSVSLIDFEAYAPSNNEPASFIASPIYDKNQRFIGVLALQVSLNKIDEIMQEKSGLGETGETYLVGKDLLMRSDSRFSNKSTVLKQTVDTESVREALNGKTDYRLMKDYRGVEVLSAYDQVGIDGLDWVILSEIDLEETLQPVYVLRNKVIIFSIFLSIAIVLVTVFIARRFTRPINKLRGVLMDLSKGKITENIQVKTQDEIHDMAVALSTLSDNMKKITHFADQIGRGKLGTEFKPVGESDGLGHALLAMRDALQEVEISTQKRNWVNDGLTALNDILKQTKDDLETCTQAVLSEVINYSESTQGALYVINDKNGKNQTMDMLACYAWDRPKYLSDAVLPGVGLIGQCWLEKERIYLKEIPDDYIQLRSGLGKALPKSLFIIPMIVNEEVFGILEIASFLEFDPYQQEYLMKACEELGVTLSGTKVYEHTRNLLEKVQHQTEELKAQEEEVRQNMEELSATQEEMVRQKREMEKEIIELREKVKEQS